MEYECLKALEPADFFYWFGEIAKIPHSSYKEEKLVAFLADFAQKRGFFWETDKANNLLVRVPATAGYEDQPPFLFQAHTDMVWQTNTYFDFDTQPLNLYVSGNKLMARDTTLGADNAVGMATMLALADGAYPHPELELLFTATEEQGMVGMRAFDCSKLKSRRMVNMDCGDSHVLCVTSAGCVAGSANKVYPVHPIPAGWQVWQLQLSGGLGGHSGLSANKGRACGGNLLGDLLLDMEVCLCQTKGSNAIIKEASAVIAAPAEIADQLQARFASLMTVYKDTDPGWQLNITPAVAESVLTREDSANLILALSTLRTGQFRCDGNRPEVILTSGQLQEFSLMDGALHLMFAVRSACDADQNWLFARYQAQLKALGIHLQKTRSYSGWQENPNSPLRQQFMAMHKKLFGREMEIERVHGGIETGIITGAIPDMDAVGIAPTARGAHTTDEYLLIDQVAPYWQLLTQVLAQKV